MTASTLTARLERQQQREAFAKSKLVEAQAMALFRSLETADDNLRKPPVLEWDTEDVMLPGWSRAQIIACTRNLYRKTSAARAQINVIRRHAYGTGPTLVLYPEADAPAARWFNTEWSPHADARGILDLDRFNSALFTNWILDGDALIFFDAAGVIPGSEGKMWGWEADQLLTIHGGDWKESHNQIAEALEVPAGLTLKQADGIIADEYGRVWGFAASHKRGGACVRYRPGDASANQCAIIRNGPARLLVSPWRLGQTRGEPDLATSADDHQYIQQIRAALLTSLNVQALIALFVKSENPAGKAEARREDASTTTVPTGERMANYRNFEKLSKGAIEYGHQGDDVHPLDMSKRNDVNAIALLESAQNAAGYGMGLARLYAQGKSDGSYSGSMAEENLSWPTILEWRKLFERVVLDFEAVSAIDWAVRKGHTTDPGEGWRTRIGWTKWPERQAINPGDAASARKTDLEIGKISWTDMHGPAAEQKLAELGRQILAGRDAGYFAPLFEPKPASKPKE